MRMLEMTVTGKHLIPATPHRRWIQAARPTMTSGKARKTAIVEGGYCNDVSCLEKVKEKGQQHAKLEKH